MLEAYRRPVSVTLRTRLRGEVYNREGELERVFYSLNEFIVNRGISGVLSTLEVRQLEPSRNTCVLFWCTVMLAKNAFSSPGD